MKHNGLALAVPQGVALEINDEPRGRGRKGTVTCCLFFRVQRKMREFCLGVLVVLLLLLVITLAVALETQSCDENPDFTKESAVDRVLLYHIQNVDDFYAALGKRDYTELRNIVKDDWVADFAPGHHLVGTATLNITRPRSFNVDEFIALMNHSAWDRLWKFEHMCPETSQQGMPSHSIDACVTSDAYVTRTMHVDIGNSVSNHYCLSVRAAAGVPLTFYTPEQLEDTNFIKKAHTPGTRSRQLGKGKAHEYILKTSFCGNVLHTLFGNESERVWSGVRKKEPLVASLWFHTNDIRSTLFDRP